jgi:hypothetical protein
MYIDLSAIGLGNKGGGVKVGELPQYNSTNVITWVPYNSMQCTDRIMNNYSTVQHNTYLRGDRWEGQQRRLGTEQGDETGTRAGGRPGSANRQGQDRGRAHRAQQHWMETETVAVLGY